jgi:hypothetical protein
MILSVHLADLGLRQAMLALARPPRVGRLPGLRYAAMTLAAPLSERVLPAPAPGRCGLVAAWDADEDLERFLAADPLAARLSRGFHARMRAVHVFGGFAPLGGLLGEEPAIDEQEPAAVLTIGRLRLPRAMAFLRASAAAEALALRSPGLLAATGLARPPQLVATFSLWSDPVAMRAYAGGHDGPGHRDAVLAHATDPFHHEAAFFRLRPYLVQGRWDGREPLTRPATV